MLEGMFLTFIISITLLTIFPGADTIMAVRNTLRGGRSDGIITSAGICTGLMIHAGISSCGLSILILSSAKAFHAIKLTGAIYLIWLGLKNMKSLSGKNSPIMNCEVKQVSVSAGKSFTEGFLSNVLNPKTALFYMAFLPQFMNPEHSLVMQAYVMAGIHAGIAMFWQTLIVLSINKVRTFLINPKIRKIIDGSLGTLLMAFGIRLAAAGR